MDPDVQVQPQIGEPLDDWTRYDPLYRSAADYLNVDVNTEWSRSRPKIERILEYAKHAARSDDPHDVMVELNKLERKFGPVSFQDKKLNHIYRNLRISKSIPNPQGKKTQLRNTEKSKSSPMSKMISKAVTGTIQKEIQTVQKQVQSEIQFALRQALKQMNNWKDRV